MTKNTTLSLCGMVLLLLTLALPCSAQTLSLDAAPAAIEMNALYDGMDLTITGQAPAGDDLVLHFTGEPTELHMRTKGKIFGLLWMNVGQVVLNNVPNVLLVEASKAFDELGPGAAPLRLEGLRDAITIESGGSPEIDAPMELVHLKQSEKMYSESTGGIEFGPEADGMRSFTATIKVPSRLTPGQYTVEAYALHQGVVTAEASLPVTARLIGIPAWLSTMAFEHGTLYGVLSVIIAILSGLAIGLVFQSKGGAH